MPDEADLGRDVTAADLETCCAFDDDAWRHIAGVLALSKRQGQIARLICAGFGYKSIALRAGISVNTVRMHARVLYVKLRVRDRLGVALRVFSVDRIRMALARDAGCVLREVASGG